MTEWRAVPGWEGLYEVSDAGTVRSLPRKRDIGRGATATYGGKTLSGSLNKNGYLQVALCDVNRTRRVGIHSIVLRAFVGPRPEGMEGCHANGVRTDNRLSNLRWDTRSANMFDCVRHGNHPFRSRTHCKQGHPYDEENTATGAHGRRICRTCNREKSARARRKAAA